MASDHGRERLRAWIASRDDSQHEIAQRLGVSQAAISKILQGGRNPGLRLAYRIERASASWSDGPIRMTEWLGGEEDSDVDPRSEAVRALLGAVEELARELEIAAGEERARQTIERISHELGESVGRMRR